MAYTGGRIGAVETEVGSYNRASALYISFERRGCQNVPGGQLNEERYAKALEAKEFFMKFLNADCPKICVENPMPLSIMQLPKPDCIIQPYEFGEPYTKRTYLWLKGLPPLAFDFMKNEKAIVRGLNIYRDYCKPNDKDSVYILTNFDTTIEEDLYRMRKVQEAGLLPDIRIYRKHTAPRILRDLQRWCNNRVLYRSCDFMDYVPRADGKSVRELYFN